MSWDSREWAGKDQFMDRFGPGGGGARSWIGGLPAPTKVVKWIIIVNVVLLLLTVLSGGASGPIYKWFSMRTDLVLRGQIWRLYTFTYLHDPSSLLHLLFNMLGLYFFGGPLESMWGSRRFFWVYSGAGLVAVLVYVVITVAGWLDPSIPLVGASGGVLALLASCAVLFPQMRLILVFFLVPIRLAVTIFVSLYVFNLATRGANAGGDACHLAGLAFGLFWAYRGDSIWGMWGRARERRAQGAWRHRMEAELEEQAAVDRILEKVHQHGMHSLTWLEKRTLQRATRRQQKDDREWGVSPLQGSFTSRSDRNRP